MAATACINTSNNIMCNVIIIVNYGFSMHNNYKQSCSYYISYSISYVQHNYVKQLFINKAEATITITIIITIIVVTESLTCRTDANTVIANLVFHTAMNPVVDNKCFLE